MKKFYAWFIWGAVALAVTTLTITALAQAEIINKPFQQWTMEDVNRLLTDSAWAQTQSRGTGIGFDNPISNAGGVIRPDSVTLRLRSGLPLRQALLRLRQINAKYDKKSDSAKVEFDEKQKPLIDCPACVDNYVVALSPSSKEGKGVPSVLRTMPIDSVKLYVQLRNEKGESRALVHFIPPKTQFDEAVFFFPRFNEKNEPLITPANKKVIVTFDPMIFGTDPVANIRFEFDVSKMIMNGEVLF